MEKIINDYLTPNMNQIRHSIRGIDDSYNNSWDILAELIQNSVDAIRLSPPSHKGIINLDIDCKKKSITIYDNGIGIDKDELPELLKPFSTNKTNVDIAIGEKGVGLKYVIFSSNYFRIKTGTNDGTAEAEILNARNWKNSTDSKGLPLAVEILKEKYKGTCVELKDIDNEIIFNLNFEQLKYLLRTRTAIGSTKVIWGKDRDITISAKFKDINSNTYEETLPFKYFLITDVVPDNSKIDINKFKTWLTEKDRTDPEKMNKLKDKIIYMTGEYTHSNQRKIQYYACFVPRRKVWSDISVKNKLVAVDKVDDEDWLSDYFFCRFDKGIHLSVKGMPTGITIEHPVSGYAGYWSNMFIIFEDPFVKFDIGRKSIHGRTVSIHKEYSKKIFNEFLKYVTKYVSGDLIVEPAEWNRDEVFSEVAQLVDLKIDGVKFQKTPTTQEASVAAIFFECVGNGAIENIIPLISGYRNKYDLYALWGKKKIVIEFKSHLRNLARDFSDARKMFDEIDCVVCWEVTDEDRQTLADMGVNIDEIAESVFAQSVKKIPHSTHILNITNFNNPIYVIDLKKVLTEHAKS